MNKLSSGRNSIDWKKVSSGSQYFSVRRHRVPSALKGGLGLDWRVCVGSTTAVERASPYLVACFCIFPSRFFFILSSFAHSVHTLICVLSWTVCLSESDGRRLGQVRFNLGFNIEGKYEPLFDRSLYFLRSAFWESRWGLLPASVDCE